MCVRTMHCHSALYISASPPPACKNATRIPSSTRHHHIPLWKPAICAMFASGLRQNGMKYNQAAWNREQAEIKSDFESCAVGNGVYLSCATGLHALSSGYMIMGVEVGYLT